MTTDVQMKLGTFAFSIDAAAYQRFTRQTEYRWPAQEVINARSVQQFTGPGDESITLSGTVYPMFDGGAVGVGQIDALRALGAQGLPQIMVDGLGNVMGKWVILRVDETVDQFYTAGIPIRQDFTLTLRKYSDGTN